MLVVYDFLLIKLFNKDVNFGLILVINVFVFVILDILYLDVRFVV